ncbi:MAG: hypothetical protein O7E53_05625 [Alphaproteobacteria bacterium]|nr:hypothetical protein [Alphaproteobacteria bacterium]
MNQRSERLADGIWRKYKLARDRLRGVKRQILRYAAMPGLAVRYSAYRKAIKQRDWPLARDRALALSELALKNRDRRVLHEMMHALPRFECFQEAARLHRAWRETLGGLVTNQWCGEELSGKTLLIDFTEKHERGLGLALLGANFVAKAAKRARHVIVVVESRLVPLYERSFPALDIRETAERRESDEIDFTATIGNLTGNFIPSKGLPDTDFYPLVADRAMAASLRAKYQNGEQKPLIGVFWYSSHHGKDLPHLKDWQRFIVKSEARFISLQYGVVEDDIRFLGADRVINDPAIDQLIDMDGFAAQIAALDAVVAISGTPVHLAGALGVPTVILRDDWFRRQWPVMTDRVPWYPNLRVAGKDGREWGEVFDDAWIRVQTLLDRQGRRP